MLATITTELDKIAPRFELQPDQITIIQTPTQFYETLKVGLPPSFLRTPSVDHSKASILAQGNTREWTCRHVVSIQSFFSIPSLH